jgi:ATP-dependent Zn protease
MAGPAAQHAVDAQGAMDSAIAGMQHAAERMEPVGLDQKQTDEVIVEAAKTAAKIIMKNIGTVRRIADVLEKKKRIEGDEIREILRQAKESV